MAEETDEYRQYVIQGLRMIPELSGKMNAHFEEVLPYLKELASVLTTHRNLTAAEMRDAMKDCDPTPVQALNRIRRNLRKMDEHIELCVLHLTPLVGKALKLPVEEDDGGKVE